MINIAFLTVAALAFGAAAIKAPGTFGRHRAPGQGLLFTLLATVGVSCLALSDTAQRAEDHVYPDLGRLLSNMATMAAAFAILSLVITLSVTPPAARPKIRRRLAALIVSVTVLAGTFAAASPLPETLGDFGDLYMSRPVLLAYIAVFIAFLGAAMAELVIMAVRYCKVARHRAWLPAGLMLMAAAGILGLVYLAEKSAYVISQVTGLPAPFGDDKHCSSLLSPAQCAFSITVPITAVLLAATGATIPVWGIALAAPARRRRQARTLRELEPLWAALCHAFPQIALPGPAGGTRSRRDARLRLYRRVIEINDGRLLLRPYIDPAIRTAAHAEATRHGLHGQRLHAAVEAAELAAGLRAHQADVPANVQPTVYDEAAFAATDVEREATWLAMVASAFITSPVVRDLAVAHPQKDP